jgi:ubiquinone/menaquinone biosynthesis C-methylase UbiE
MAQHVVFTNRIAENYEKYMAPMFFAPYAVDIAGRLGPANISSLLEIACGTGQVTRLLRARLPEARIVATDLNPGMLDTAKQIINPADKVEWLTADAQNLPFDDNSFDAVICTFGMMFMPDKQKAVSEVYRVLKPGGRFLFNTWDALDTNPASKIVSEVIASYFDDFSFNFYNIPFGMCDTSEIEALLSLTGFNSISVERVHCAGYSATAENGAIALIEGTPAYLAICAHDEKLIPDIRKTATEALEKEFGSVDLNIPNSALVAEGVK